MNKQDIKNAIYKKYIVPTQRKRKDYVGVEFELPIVNLNKKAVDFSVVHKLADAFVEFFKFKDIKRDDDCYIFSATSNINGDGLSFDCSYNTLELSFGTESNLNILYTRFKEYYSFIQAFLLPYNHTLTGMGINPYREYNNNIPIPSERYRMLFHHLSSYTKYNGGQFHNYPNFGFFSCASQVQLDVEEENIIEVINTFSKLEPLKSVLFANSPLEDFVCSRDFLWRNSLHGLNKHNVDMFDDQISTVDDIVDYIENMSLYCIERDGKYINFPPTNLDKYFTADSITGEYWDKKEYKSITFEPKEQDLEFLRSFKFEDLTFRGTVEFRSVCAQPVSEIMASAAFHTGLIENLDKLTDILDNDTVIYNHGYNASELRAMFNKRYFPDFVDSEALSKLLTKIIDIAKEGLKIRSYNEEDFLTPLYSRARHLYCPATQMLDGLQNGVALEYYIKEYSEIE